MDSQNNKNTILAITLSVMVLIAWQFFYVTPKMQAERKAAEIAAQRDAAASNTQASSQSGTPSQTTGNDIPSHQNATGTAPEGAIPGSTLATREAAIANSPRITFENDHIKGSINLRSARIDDLALKDYHMTIDKTSPLVTLLSPTEAENGYFAEFGFVGSAASGDVPGPDTVWTNSTGGTLTQSTPVTLEWSNSKGVTFKRTIALDDTYLFTITDEVMNNSGEAVSLSPYGRITRFGLPITQGVFVLHEGLIGVFGEEGLKEIDYKDIRDDKEVRGDVPDGYDKGWIGITDKYWAAAMVPNGKFKPRFAYFTDGRERYQSDFLGEPLTIAAGSSTKTSHLLFAGAKKEEIIDRYDVEQEIGSFDLLIDWGWFYFITKPLFKMMNWLFHLVGNFGVAILITTVIIKAVLFPLANMSYASMAKMKKVQPEMQKLKERAGDDRVKLQQDMMALYKKEKINPAAGCWPMLVQIPVFFALYKVIYVTIEMRHAPFFGWIQDLSAPDPTSMFNLFGLLPYDVPGFLLIGIWPLLMGITMFLQMQMNPTPPDPTQAMIFKWMPIVFTFMLATFPAGLVIYWAWNNSLSILQQGMIMKRNGVKVELLDNIRGMFGGNAKKT
jgi:YidC/Oxa1 family membrane protein insertase